MSTSSLQWARDLRRELKAEIQILTRRAGADDGNAEALGLVPQTDHLADLRARLAQVERLIDAIEGPQASGNQGWFPAMVAGDAATQSSLKAAG